MTGSTARTVVVVGVGSGVVATRLAVVVGVVAAGSCCACCPPIIPPKNCRLTFSIPWW